MHPDLFRKQYDFELEQRNGLTSATNLPIIAITVLASATSVALLDYRFTQDLQSYAFGSFAGASLLAITFSVYSAFRSFWNYDYQKLPSAKALRQHGESLSTWHLQNGSSPEEAKALTEADFTEYLTGQIVEAADWNGQNNVVRGNYLHRATAAIALGVALFLPAALLYAHNKATAEEKVHQVRLTEPVLIKQQEPKVSSNKPPSSSTQPASAPAPAPAPAQVPSAKPAGPPNLVFKGGSDLTKPSAGPVPPKK